MAVPLTTTGRAGSLSGEAFKGAVHSTDDKHAARSARKRDSPSRHVGPSCGGFFLCAPIGVRFH